MIRQRFRIGNYNWKVVVFYEVDESDLDYVIDILKEICYDEAVIHKAVRNLSAGVLNNGFIYSNFDTKESLIVIGKASSKDELIDTITHEANHLQSHIATAFNLDEKGEAVCYLIAYIVKTMYQVFGKIICH